MNDIIKFLMEFIISPGIPEKKDLKTKSFKIFFLIVLFLIIINLLWYLTKG